MRYQTKTRVCNSVRCILSGLALALILCTGAVMASTPTAQQCTDEYEDSDAYDACTGGTHFNVFVSSAGECEFADSCPLDAGGTRRTNIGVSLDDADDLVVCNGELKVSSCP